MPVKFIAEVVKGLFGVSGTDAEEPADAETNITVERETADGTDDSPADADVTPGPDEGEDDETEDVVDTAEESVDVEDSADAEEDDSDAERAGADVSVQEISGIGPTYSERLAERGIETVADLAGADPDDVAETAQVSASRATDWISQAESW